MRVAFLTPSVSRALGGIFEIERELAHALVAHTPAEVEVYGLRDEHTAADLDTWAPLQPRVFDVKGPSVFGYAPTLAKALQRVSADLLHLHALWMYTSVASLRWARRTGRPHIVTINGMLDPWAVENARWKKRLAGWAYEDANLREASCLQVNTEDEYESVRAYGIDTPICIIPNGVTLPDLDSVTHEAPWKDQIPPGQRVLLFLGRIHPKKGLEELLHAWDQIKADTTEAKEWHLAIVGWDDGGHEQVLRQKAEELNLSGSVHFLGPRFGAEKGAAFHHADAFILPSHSEGLPMAVLEAWSFGLPVVMTPACNIPEGFRKDAAISTTPNPENVAQSLSDLFGQSKDEREEMGQRGRKLVEHRFTWPQVAKQMYEVYRWTLGDGPRPECVRLS